MKDWLPVYITAVLLFIFTTFYFALWRAPANFPILSIYTVEEGVGLRALSNDLAEADIIRSPFWFKVFSVLAGGSKGIIAGDYALNEVQNVMILADRISQGEYHLVPLRITINEGLNVFEIADLLAKKFSKVSKDEFIQLSQNSEGYLFPDTYFFLPNISSKYVIKEMKDNFQNQIKNLETEIKESDRSFENIIKMASIVEKEAYDFETRQIIAGILWERIEIGMPLQVDVSFKYINGKVTEDLTLADLKLDSPYNSYLYKGLPPTPISNPGLEAIKATITPIKTDYLYFLAGGNGKTYYAKTYADHLQNKKLYLR